MNSSRIITYTSSQSFTMADLRQIVQQNPEVASEARIELKTTYGDRPGELNSYQIRIIG